MNTANQAVCAQPDEVLVVQLGARRFGIDMRKVQEIRTFESFARAFGRAGMLNGQVNLHGLRVPVVDLRALLAGATPHYDAATSVVIVTCDGRATALIVDDVDEVFNAAAPGAREATMLVLERLVQEALAAA